MICRDRSILVVEDDFHIRDTLKDVLEADGYSVRCVTHGKEAMDLLSDTPFRPTLILLDMMMPVMNGWEFLDVFGKDPRFKRIPIVITTASTDLAKLSMKPAAIIPKPIELELLLEVVDRHSTLCCVDTEPDSDCASNSKKIAPAKGAEPPQSGEWLLDNTDRLMLKRIGLKISKKLHEMDKSLDWLAIRSDVARSTLRELIAGRSNPRILTLNAIVRGLGYQDLLDFFKSLSD